MLQRAVRGVDDDLIFAFPGLAVADNDHVMATDDILALSDLLLRDTLDDRPTLLDLALNLVEGRDLSLVVGGVEDVTRFHHAFDVLALSKGSLSFFASEASEVRYNLS